ncbi:MAG TPA: DUF5130 family protein [Candidatus Nanopelagicales bacterium]|nr:DUF5130 family protein [Candidatus Nanopelagicales bacterium]
MDRGENYQVSAAERTDIERIVQRARDICGFEFAVFIGELPHERESAIAVHAGLHDPDAAVLIAIDPGRRTMDIVTGGRVKRNIDDRTCEFAMLTLRSSLNVNDVVGGVRDGVSLLAEHARVPRTLHLDEPA